MKLVRFELYEGDVYINPVYVTSVRSHGIGKTRITLIGDVDNEIIAHIEYSKAVNKLINGE